MKPATKLHCDVCHNITACIACTQPNLSSNFDLY